MNVRISAIAIILIFFWISTAIAELDSVSGWVDTEGTVLAPTVVPAEVAYSLANGFPIWYRDEKGLKLQLCLDQAVQKADGGFFFPCFLENPSAGAPVSFPNNFGPEAFWYASNASAVFDSLQDGAVLQQAGEMLFRGDLEAAFGLDLGAFDGDQIAFSRIRLRISVPRPGIYEVTHPYGTFTYHVESTGRRVINQTQDIGSDAATSGLPFVGGDFTRALFDGEPVFGGSPPAGFDFSVNAGVVNEDGRSIGPFLVAADAPGGAPLSLIESFAGDLYLSDPGFGALHNTSPVMGGPYGNVFRLELLALFEVDPETGEVVVDPETAELVAIEPGPGGDIDGFFLNAAGSGSQVVEVAEFQLSGKLFLDLPNEPPVAEPVFIATSPGRTVAIDVRGHVRDDFVGDVNEYGIRLPLQAIGLPTDPRDLSKEIKLARPLITDDGRVQRFTNVSTGVATFRYTPVEGFTGIDTFHYVVQDEGGLLSAPAQVTVLVEEVVVERAEYRPRIGKWRIEGTSTFNADNSVTLYSGPRATLSGLTDAAGLIALFPRQGELEYFLKLDPLPITAVQRVHVRLGSPEAPGPVIFELFFSGRHGPFTGSRRAIVRQDDIPSPFVSQPLFGITSFAEGVEAILSGNTHINVVTAVNPGGELRGALIVPEIGTAKVDPLGRWVFEGKSIASPGALPNVSAETKHGVRFPGAPLHIR